MSDDPTTSKTEETFTRAQVRSMIAAEVRKVSERFADYDDLKARAGEADKSKTQLDKVLEKLTAAEERTAKLEAAQTRSSVITEKKLPANLAKWLPKDGTAEELASKADELLADWKESGGKVAGNEGGDAEQEGNEGKGTPPARPAAGTGRPREDLRSGAPVTPRAPEETDPLKLAALIPRN
jgi:hypothetical protein